MPNNNDQYNRMPPQGKKRPPQGQPLRGKKQPPSQGDSNRPRKPKKKPSQNPNMPMNDVSNGDNIKMGKAKKPLTKGGAFGIAFIVSFLLLLVFSAGLIFVSVMRSAGEQAVYQQLLTDAENKVKEASVDVAFSPAESIRQKTLMSSVNFKILRKPNASTVVAEGEHADGQAIGNSTSAPTVGQQPTIEQQEANEKANDGQAQGAQAPAVVPQQQPATTTPAVSSAPNTPLQQSSNDLLDITYGSGVIISKKGDMFYVLTNNHVVQNAEKISATIGEATYDGDLVGYDASSDLAIVSISAKNLQVAQIGDSNTVIKGDYTIAVGNPFGLNDSMTTGIISGLGRNFTMVSGVNTIMYANMLQTDTPVNAGNSGGGLYNANGDLIGINTLISSDTANSNAIGYAIPINYAIPIAKNLMDNQSPAHASLGLSVSNIPQEQVAKFGLINANGAYIINVTPSGPANTAGIVSGDIIVSYNNKPVTNAQDLLFKIRSSVINEQHQIKVLREGKEMSLNVKVGSDV